jgi:phage repressor protein C with HTH and peptisase S24 domain
MHPTLPDTSKVTLDLSDTTILDGKVYGIRYGEELRIKRLFKRFDGGLIIRSDNSAKHPEESIDPEQLEHIAVIGRYVAHSFDGDL